MKVIFIIPFSPVYKNLNKISLKEESLTDPYQLNEAGEKVYLFRQDWGGVIGEQVIKCDKSVTWEIWRPDIRADKLYEHTFQDGLVCKSFPVSKRFTFYGLKPKMMEYSNQLEKALVKEADSKQKTVILLPTTVDFSRFLHRKVQKLHQQILYYHFLNPEFLLPEFDFILNPVKLLHRILINSQKAMRLRYIQNLQVLSEDLKETIETRYPSKKILLARIGIDLSYWQNVTSREEARAVTGLDKDKFVFLMSQRLVSEYQIDRWLEALSKLGGVSYQCIITGTGDKAYVDYLSSLISKYKLEDKVKLVGFVSRDILRTYFTACDCFAMPGKVGGGSTGAIYAMNMNRQVLHTDSGVSYEMLKKFGAGVILKPYSYEEWPSIIDGLLEDQTQYSKVPEGYIQDLFSWDKCTLQWLDAINNL